jgi:hypothetical protein
MKPNQFFDENAVQKLKEQESPYSPAVFRWVLFAIVLGTMAILFLCLSVTGIPRIFPEEVEALSATPTTQIRTRSLHWHPSLLPLPLLGLNPSSLCMVNGI